MHHEPLIFDYQSTTPCILEVLQAMEPYWDNKWGNPSNKNNRYGIHASAAISVARDQIADSLRIDADRIIFTSGATEANNLALLGHARARAKQIGRTGHLITIATEHQAVLAPMRQLQREGFLLTEIEPNCDGLISIEQFKDALRSDTFMVSIMMANNEIGVLQPLLEIGCLCREKGVVFHSDVAQALGYVDFEPDQLNLDMFSLSAHKIYGPKGIGALIRSTSIPMQPLQWGGGQENGLRAGTLPVPLIMGFAKAIELATKDVITRNHRLKTLRNILFEGLKNNLSGCKLNGSLNQRLPHNLNITFDGVNGNRMHSKLRSLISCTNGSACNNGEPSHVLLAIGRSKKEADASLRLSIGRSTTNNDVQKAIAIITNLIQSLRHS